MEVLADSKIDDIIQIDSIIVKKDRNNLLDIN